MDIEKYDKILVATPPAVPGESNIFHLRMLGYDQIPGEIYDFFPLKRLISAPLPNRYVRGIPGTAGGVATSKSKRARRRARGRRKENQ